MKILYAIQGTGNGHISRAREIIPYLKKYGELDLLVSGTQAEVNLQEDIKYQFNGFGFVFGTKGGIDFRETWRRFDMKKFSQDVMKLPIEQYQLIINDFEPVTAWACRLKSKKSVALSHQSSYLSKKTPQLDGFHWGKLIMNSYAPATHHIAFHFQKYDDFIHTPVIRSEVRNLVPQKLGHITVYLPAYSDDFIVEKTSKYPSIRWEIFSKHTKNHYTTDNAEVFPINNELFQKSLQNCNGLLTGGGFEGPAEALFLQKKVLSVPMNHQYEQQCNALALEKMGVPVIWNPSEFDHKLEHWIHTENTINVDFPDETESIVEKLVSRYAH